MKTKKLTVLVSLLCVVCMALLMVAATGCGSTELTYSGSTLTSGQVGTAYSASVGTATGAENITYALKSGSTLPAGLTLAASGAISGTPTAAADNHKFTVVATAGDVSKEAEFTITITGSAGVKFEAEWADYTDAEYMAGSFTPKKFDTLDTASNGVYARDLGYADCTVRFNINSSAAGEATMTVAMKTSIASSFNINSDFVKIKVNTATVSYTGTTLAYPSNNQFTTFDVTINLVAGDNVIEFITTDDASQGLNGVPVMPDFDYISIQADGELTWEPNLDNYE